MPSTILSDNGVSSGSAGLKTTAASDGSLALQTTTAGGVATTAVTIDTSQNVGVGVTPSAWNTFKGMQLVGGSLMSFSNAYVDLWQNSYYDGSNVRYVNTGYASYYRQNSGQHQWFTAASGTGGNVATFTQALTLNANGVLALQGASTSANGVGITFPTTAIAHSSSNANTLDDYEEGSFTPTISGTGMTYNQQLGIYTKVGNLVHVQGYLSLSGGTVTIPGTTINSLPFTSANINNASYGMAVQVYNSNGGITYGAGKTESSSYVQKGSTYIVFEYQGSAVSSSSPSAVSNTASIYFSATYYAA